MEARSLEHQSAGLKNNLLTDEFADRPALIQRDESILDRVSDFLVMVEAPTAPIWETVFLEIDAAGLSPTFGLLKTCIGR